jgi:CubicO group peptidase (beta-lactamase class C family)
MVAGKIIGQRWFANPIQQSNTVGDQSQRTKLGETDMEMHSRLATSRRSFLSMAGMGAMATLLPTPVWSKLAREYPTIKAEIEGYIATKKAAGAIAAIGHGLTAPDIISAGTIAFGDQTPVDMDSLFRIYSMTKPIAGMAAMILIGEGRMKLDQPIADFLPEFKEMRVLTDPANSLDTVPAKTQITVRHLLTHTAGLGYSIITKGPLLKVYLDNGITPGAVSRMKFPGIETGAPTPDLKTFAERLAKLPLIAEPGTKWSYSISLDLLGRVIEVASGMDFETFLQTRIFTPLKMNSTYFTVPQSEVKRFTSNYAVFNGAMIPIDPAATSVYLDKPALPSGGGGLVSSTRDYDRFLSMLLHGGTLDGTTIMSPETAALGMSNLLPAEADTKGTWVEGLHFGAGGRVGTGATAGTFGWGGAAGTSAFVHRFKKVRATGMIQYMPSNSYPFQADFPKWVLADLGA